MNNPNSPLGSQESWQMFVLTGNPAYYLLYKGITEEPDGEEEKQRR